MTTVSFALINKRVRVTATEHTMSLVCHGVSAFMFALESYLLNHSDLAKHHKSDFKAGYAEIEFTPLEWDIYPILGFIYEGLLQIEHTYGKQFLVVNISENLKSLLG